MATQRAWWLVWGLTIAMGACTHKQSTEHCTQEPVAQHGTHAAGAEGQHGHGHDHAHRFAHADEWVEAFEAPERDAWQQPERVLELVKLQAGQRVADLGAATGYFSVRLARAQGTARVWAVDVEPDMVRYLNARARREHLDNLFSLLGTFEDPLFPEPMDTVLVVDTYHHISARVAYFTHLKASLKPGARVVIVDFRLDSPEGPRPEERLSPETVREEFAAAGYEQEGSVAWLPRQYVLVFRMKP